MAEGRDQSGRKQIPGRCVMLVSPDRPAPEQLTRWLSKHHVSTVVQTTPLRAMAELGCMEIEHRQRSAHDGLVAPDNGSTSEPGDDQCVLLVVEPDDFPDLDDLTAGVKRFYPGIGIWHFNPPSKRISVIEPPGRRLSGRTDKAAEGSGRVRRSSGSGLVSGAPSDSGPAYPQSASPSQSDSLRVSPAELAMLLNNRPEEER
jgi:hypothetical protein